MNPLREDLDHILAHTAALWEELRDARIFLTGGTGFFGCWLLESFAFANAELQLGARAVVLTRSLDRFRRKAPQLAENPAIDFLQGSVTEFDFPDAHFSHVIHAATETTPLGSAPDPAGLFVANVQATRRILEFSVGHGTRKFLFTSSGAVYGPQPAEITHVPETYLGAPSPLDVATAYGQSKRASEFLCAAYAQRSMIDAAIARCFAFVGPHLPLDANYAIGNFTRDAVNGGPVHVAGDGTPFRSYLYAADLAIWLWTILLRGTSGQAYNVGSDYDLTIAQWAKTVTEVVCPAAEVIVAGTPRRETTPSRYVPAIDRAREELGLEPWIDLREGIRRMAEWNRRAKT